MGGERGSEGERKRVKGGRKAGEGGGGGSGRRGMRKGEKI